MAKKRISIVTVCVIVLAYLAFGVNFYVNDLRYSRLAVRICPPGVYPSEPHVQMVDGTPQSVIDVPDCPQQTVNIANELTTAPTMILGWLPLILGRMLMHSDYSSAKDNIPAGTQVSDPSVIEGPREVPSELVHLFPPEMTAPQEIIPDMLMPPQPRSDAPNPLTSIDLDKVTDTGISKVDVVRIADTAHLYSVEIPRDWKITLSGTEDAGDGRLLYSWLGSQSRDWVLETLGYNGSPTHVRSGAAMEIHVSSFEGNTTSQFINMATKYLASGEITVNGIAGKLFVDQEFDPPYHEDVLAIESHLSYMGKYYAFRITYNPTTYPQGAEVFMRMLKSLEFTQ